jgi:hypothetical protein
MRHASFSFLPTVALALAACANVQEPTPLRTIASASAVETTAPGPADADAKVDVCHRTSGDNTFFLLSVAPSSVAAHMAHGDGKIGDPVPSQPGMGFGADCRPEVVVTHEWRQQESYSLDCAERPAGTVCLLYADGFVWLVNDVIHDWVTRTEDIGTIVSAIGERATYEHVLGTNLVRIAD